MVEKGITTNEKNGKTMEQLQADTEKNKSIYSTVWIPVGGNSGSVSVKQMKNQNPGLRQFLRRFRRPLDYKTNYD